MLPRSIDRSVPDRVSNCVSISGIASAISIVLPPDISISVPSNVRFCISAGTVTVAPVSVAPSVIIVRIGGGESFGSNTSDTDEPDNTRSPTTSNFLFT